MTDLLGIARELRGAGPRTAEFCEKDLCVLLRGFRRLASALLLLLMLAPARAAGQGGLPAGTRKGEILFLGTSGGPPLRKDRSEPSTLLIVDDREYLITPHHPDHDLGLADLMANDYLRARSADVFTGDTGPADAVTRLAKATDVLVPEVNDAAETAKFIKESAEQNHWSPERTKEFTARMKFEHLDLQAVGEMAAKAQVKSVPLYHYTPRDPAAYVAGVKKYFAGPVFAPADLDRYCLSTRHASTSTPTLSQCSEHAAAH